jgi:hypothetical protein
VSTRGQPGYGELNQPGLPSWLDWTQMVSCLNTTAFDEMRSAAVTVE